MWFPCLTNQQVLPIGLITYLLKRTQDVNMCNCKRNGFPICLPESTSMSDIFDAGRWREQRLKIDLGILASSSGVAHDFLARSSRAVARRKLKHVRSSQCHSGRNAKSLVSSINQISYDETCSLQNCSVSHFMLFWRTFRAKTDFQLTQTQLGDLRAWNTRMEKNLCLTLILGWFMCWVWWWIYASRSDL